MQIILCEIGPMHLTLDTNWGWANIGHSSHDSRIVHIGTCTCTIVRAVPLTQLDSKSAQKNYL